MTAGPSAEPLAAPVLVVRTRAGEHRLRPGGVYQVGRDPGSDIVINEARVSWRHALIRAERDHWTIEDASSNGTFLDGRRITRLAISGEQTFRLGNATDGTELRCIVGQPPRPQQQPQRPQPRQQQPPPSYGPPPPQQGPPRQWVDRRPSQIIRVAPRTLRIGRGADNDVVVADLVVSRHHAELRTLGPGRHEIRDLGSHNGTYVNGVRVQSSPFTENDLLGVGHATFQLVGSELREFIDTGDVSVQVQDLVVRTGDGKVIMDGVGFPIPERSLVAVIGPSGAGKSTLLGAVTGMRPATEGSVHYDGRDLYRDYDELRHRIGLVPQDDILHTQLATRQALAFAAELRFPGDTKREERERRVDEVIGELGLTAHAKTRIDKLSGGQRKRVSVALELLTKPSLLFLDEPTSGLDPGLDKTVMEMLSGLAHDGRTVIVVTHSVANLDTCDRLLVLVPGGKLAYYGPPAEGLEHFGKRTWAEVFQAFEREPARDWSGEFRASARYQRYVASGLTGGGGGQNDAARPSPPPPQQSKFGQLSTLCRRYLAVIASDRSYLALIGIMPLLLGGLILAIPAGKGLVGPPGTNVDAPSKMMVLVFAACFVGAGNAIRELVKERTIYQRERAAGLSAAVYLMSKLIVLGVITGIQAVVLVGIGLIGAKTPDSGLFLPVLPEIMIAMAVLGWVSLALGLLMSASVNSSEKTLPLLIVSSMGQLVLCGALIALNGKAGLEQLAWISPSRWGLGAAASTIDLGVIQQGAGPPDPLWKHTQANWLMNIGIECGLGLLFVILTWWRLERLRPRRR
ncbi:FHA domain-containing protein [Actinomadura parmotrematis]|uniref:FHA domain-containing protein n=1 Tax=Actinomadura parmotrematis TaxID=2864039 RepID=A0ABS7G328_9ACTN|nr:FHA domain-containing protein [Actinomadura parmotrematis]MBW8486615.1 FHA domain-containing protein [Actinomadura parmotrematis]